MHDDRVEIQRFAATWTAGEVLWAVQRRFQEATRTHQRVYVLTQQFVVIYAGFWLALSVCNPSSQPAIRSFAVAAGVAFICHLAVRGVLSRIARKCGGYLDAGFFETTFTPEK